MSTDLEWEKWGARDPYFGVLTHPKFRRSALDEAARQEFFGLGELHVATVLDTCRARLDPDFSPRRVLDFGCGVARILIPFARRCEQAVGVDVSPSMLAEAARNCEAAGVHNVSLVRSDDALSQVHGNFDLVHSVLVLQHIEIARGLLLIERLIAKICPGGVGVLHITLGWDFHDANLGVPLPSPPPAPEPRWGGLRQALRKLVRPGAPTALPPATPPGDPEMQMNFYNFSQVLYLVEKAGAGQAHLEFTNHGGCVGAFVYFRRPPNN